MVRCFLVSALPIGGLGGALASVAGAHNLTGPDGSQTGAAPQARTLPRHRQARTGRLSAPRRLGPGMDGKYNPDRVGLARAVLHLAQACAQGD